MQPNSVNYNMFYALNYPSWSNWILHGCFKLCIKIEKPDLARNTFEVWGQLYILIFCLKSKVIALVSSFNSIMTSPSLLWKVWAKFNPFTMNLMWLVIHNKLLMTCEQLWIKKRTFYYYEYTCTPLLNQTYLGFN